MRRLAILVLGINYAPEHTGVAPYTTGLARMLAAQGHSVHVVTGFPHYPQWRVADGYRGWRRHEWDGPVRITRVRHPVPSRPTGIGRIVMEASFALAAATARVRRPDVVLAVSPALLSVATALRWRLGPRGHRTVVGAVVQDLYGSVVAEAGVLDGRGGSLVARLERALLGRVDGVAVVHEVFRESLGRAGLDPATVSVVRNWTHIVGAHRDPAARAELGWPADRTIALHAGNMGAKQGLENVVEAARRAQERSLPVLFVLLGAGNQRARLEELAGDCTHLRFMDPLPDGRFEAALATADVLVLNERPTVTSMCIPSKLTSYFAAGRPVVAATAPGSPAAQEMAASGAGLVVEPGKPQLLLDAVCTLGMAAHADPDGVDDLGAAGRRYAETHCSVGAARRGYLAWVLGLVGTAAVPAPRPSRTGTVRPARRRGIAPRRARRRRMVV